MAIVTEVTISTGNTVGIGGQARQVGITLSYRLEREDSDVMQVVRDKAAEVARAHQAAWKSIRDQIMDSRSDVPGETAVPQDAQALADEEEFETLLRERFGCSRPSELSPSQAGSLLVELQRNSRERLARHRTENGRVMPARSG